MGHWNALADDATQRENQWAQSATTADNTLESARADAARQQAIDAAGVQKQFLIDLAREDPQAETRKIAALAPINRQWETSLADADLAWTQSIAGAEKTFQTGGAGAVKDYVLAVSSDQTLLANDLAQCQTDFDQAAAAAQISFEAPATAAAAVMADRAVCHGLQWNAPPNRTRQPPLQAVLPERNVAMGRCPST